MRTTNPEPFIYGKTVCKWQKIEDGFYFVQVDAPKPPAESSAFRERVTLIARRTQGGATFRTYKKAVVIDRVCADVRTAAAEAVAELRELTGVQAIQTNGGALIATADARLVNAVAVAAARERSRFAFNGVRFGEGRIAATDGKRMHLATLDSVGSATVLVPIESFRPLLKGSVEIHESMIGNRPFAALDGAFPNPERVIPKITPLRATVDAEAFLEALRLTGKMTNDESRSVRFAFSDKSICMKSRTMDVGDAETVCRATVRGEFTTASMTDRYKPDEIERFKRETAFNPRFLSDAVEFVAPKGGKVKLKLSGRDTPMRVEGPEADRLAVVMPVTVRTV